LGADQHVPERAIPHELAEMEFAGWPIRTLVEGAGVDLFANEIEASTQSRAGRGNELGAFLGAERRAAVALAQ